MTRNTTAIGAAAAHIVCADLLLHGVTAFLASEGQSYDVVADLNGKLIRIQTKGAQKASVRRANSKAPAAYKFLSCRNHRPLKSGASTRLKFYDQTDADLMAFVALDIRVVAYLPIVSRFVQGIHFFPSGTSAFKRSGGQRRIIDAFPFLSAIEKLGG